MASDVGMRDMANLRAAHFARTKGQSGLGLQRDDYAMAAGSLIAQGMDTRFEPSVAAASARTADGIYKGVGAYRARDRGGVPMEPNPWFAANGMGDRGSPVTQRYLRSRLWKDAIGPVASGAGGLGRFAGSVINVGSAARHSTSAAATGLHLAQIVAIARAAPSEGETIARWCQTIMKMKTMKLTQRAALTTGATQPVPLGSTIIHFIATASGVGMLVGMHEACYIAAIEIHWRAFQEQNVSEVQEHKASEIQKYQERHILEFGIPKTRPPPPAPTGKKALRVGFASRIFTEIFARRGLTTPLGEYDVGSLIREPAGWMALGDKLLRD